ncbi:MAG: translational GTPase TypA [Pseudomonadota bacterium]|nr:translational GTPase TypA [Pseudomonadota bacterium]
MKHIKLPRERLRNVAIIAHVDHGKTTLVDCLLRQSGTWDAHQAVASRVMDSGDQERERGITITAKNTAITWRDHRINIVDTPGHADFGGEVERILSMVDSVLLLVDAVDGPMPQTRFVTAHALARGLRPLVVINKVDRAEARPDWVLNRTFDLFDRLGASDEQLDFPVIYASAVQGYAGLDPRVRSGDMTPLLDAMLEQVPAPAVKEGPLQMQISSLAFSSFVGAIGIGRIHRGELVPGQTVSVVSADGGRRKGRILQVFGFRGLERFEIEGAGPGDIVGICGIEPLHISDTLCDPGQPEALPALSVDEPTMVMNFAVNKSPFAGRDGKFLTARQIRERLDQELISNVALRVEPTADQDVFRVAGRGELHLAILIEQMRREGYELAVSRPEVIEKEIDGVRSEPYELAIIEVDPEHQGAVVELLGSRKAQMQDMQQMPDGRLRLEYLLPSRALIGFRGQFLTATSGHGTLHHVFDHYGTVQSAPVPARRNGVLVSMADGKAVGYALFNLQERGRLFIGAGDDVYEGMVVGIHSRENDLVVNPMKTKQLTNIRAAGNDENILLTSPHRVTLEWALEFVEDDELVEVTPSAIRIRKRYLKESDRKREARRAVG